uniref:BTB domain-containing protein n=1 Tax=Oryza brachyantha TaxID=4533 RepID=J3L4P2_ORYBR
MATMKLGSKPEIFVLEGLTWRCMTELESDVVVEVGEMSFYLHKFPLLSRSGVLQRMISEYQAPEEGGGMCTLQLDDIPGGAKAFELAARFCYDVKIELNALNVVCLRCAAEYLRMTDDYAEGNLITQAESFLADVLANWKDSIKALETCEGVLPTAEDLHISEADADADEGKGKDPPAEAITDVKARVSELEKECQSMKQEIRRLGRPRRSWRLLTRKCGFGTKVQQAQPAMSGK